jgi:hypothetical protein
MKPVLKSAAERLQFAKAEIKRTERRIDDATERRRAILREHDANSTAAIRADDEIAALRLLRLRYIDQAELLSTVAAQKNRETWPSDLPAALAAEAETGRISHIANGYRSSTVRRHSISALIIFGKGNTRCENLLHRCNPDRIWHDRRTT